MSRKSVLGLVLFACLITTGLFVGATYMMHLESASLQDNQMPAPTLTADESDDGEAIDTVNDTTDTTDNEAAETGDNKVVETGDNKGTDTGNDVADEADKEGTDMTDAGTGEPWLSANPSDTGVSDTASTDETFSTSVGAAAAPELILDSEKVDYMSYIPEMAIDSQLEAALDISNPSISVDAAAAILFDANTKKVLYYKDAVVPMFPASTAKLLTTLTALKRCGLEEQVTVGDEITMIATDSTTAYLQQGEILTIKNLLSAMLLPSGNDAAYVTAAYVGRKSLQNPQAAKEEAIAEFVRLMNLEAAELGVKNSCFKTPDGYDAIGQYTTAYDMGLIGIAAAENDIITEVCLKSSSRNVLVSGEDVTWTNTNKLITRYSGQYYSNAIGLKTGTSTMAGRCLIGAAEDGEKKVVCVIMDSSATGRWEDAITLLKYGLNH